MRGNEAMMISIDRPSFNRRLEFDSIDAVLGFVETEDVLWQWTNATTIPATLQFAAENYRGGKWMARVRTDAEALKAKLILTALFRPGSDGIVKDDAAPEVGALLGALVRK
jgi:hypothetical protein